MKRLLFISLFLFLLVGQALAVDPAFLGMMKGQAASCTAYLSQIETGGNYPVAYINYGGQQDYTPSGNHTLCRIDFSIADPASAGSANGKTFNMYVFTLSGTSLDTQVGKSDNVTGPLAVGMNTFTFTTKPTLTSGTTYAIVIACSDCAGDFAMTVDIKSGSTVFGSNVGAYLPDKSRTTNYSTWSHTMVLYE